MRKQFILLFAFLFSGILLQAQQTVTIGTGTTSQNGPITGYRGYERMATLYTPSDGLVAGYITQLAWNKGSGSAATIPVKIYLREVTDTSLPSTASMTWNTLKGGAALVFDASLTTPAASGWFTVDLNEGVFNYSGTNNLMVLVECNLGGSGTSSQQNYWYYTFSGTNNNAYASADGYMDDDDTFDDIYYYGVSGRDNFRPNIQITISSTPPVICSRPLNLTANNITSTGADLNWYRNGSASQWIVSYKAASDVAWTDDIAYDTAYSFTSLTPATTYTVNVMGYCGIGDTSSVASVTFTTPCVAATLPIFENFDALSTGTPVPVCWYRKQDYSFAEANVSDYEYYSPFNGYSLYNAVSSSTQNTALISPYFSEPVNTLRTRFMAMAFFWYSAATLKIGYMTNPADMSTFRLYKTISLTDTWTQYKITFDTASFSGNYIVFLHGNANHYDGIYIDNIFIEPIPLCPDVENITPTSATNENSITLSFTTAGTSTPNSFNVEYREMGTTVWQTTIFNASPGTITGLMDSTAYEIRIQSDCGSNVGVWSDSIIVSTTQIPVAIPFTEDFENAPSWAFINGTQTNKWAIGVATNTNNTAGGTHGLYISNDNGVTNAYSHTTSYVYATKAIQFNNAGGYLITYDWKNMGEDNSDRLSSTQYDCLRVLLMPAGIVLTAGSAPETLPTTPPMYANAINLYGNPGLSNSNTWQHKEVAFAVPQPGVYNLVMLWDNDDSGGDNPPATIDNISITELTCSMPIRVTTTGITTTGATVHFHAPANASSVWIYYKPAALSVWDSVNVPVSNNANDTTYLLTNLLSGTKYQYYLKTDCSSEYSPATNTYTFQTECVVIATLPWSENFDSETAPNLPACWGKIAQYSYASVTTTSSNSISSPNSVDLHNSSSSSLQATILLSPPLSSNLSIANLRTRFIAESVYSGNLRVGIMTDPSDASTFIPVDTVPLVSGYWIDVISSKFSTVVQPAGTWYIAYEHGNTTTYQNIYIDDIIIEELPPCPDVLDLYYTRFTNDSIYITYSSSATNFYIEYRIAGASTWGNTSTTDTIFGIGGLQSNTQYEIRVRSICGSDSGVWTYSIFCTTDQIPVSIPFTEDFEGTPDWAFVNGTQTNKWAIGTAANTNNTSGGSYGLYISNNNGVTNAYSTTSESYVYATKLLQFTNAGDYSIEFDWKSNGESGYDYLRVWLAPANASITAGSSPSTSNWINLYGDDNLVGQSTWQHKQTTFLIPQSGVYKLVFYWENDGGSGTQPPAAVDNISVTASLCSRPVNSQITDIATISADVRFQAPANGQTVYVYYKTTAASTWDSMQVSISTPLDTVCHLTGLQSNTEYKVYIKVICSATDVSLVTNTLTFQTSCVATTLPFLETFTSTIFPPSNCWNLMDGLLPTDGTAVSLSSNAIWGIDDFANDVTRGKSASVNVYGTDTKGWLITPFIDLGSSGNAILEFDLALTDYYYSNRAEGIGLDDKFVVLISSTGSWTINDTLALWDNAGSSRVYFDIDSAGEHVTIPLTNRTGEVRIAFYVESTSGDPGGPDDCDLFVDSIRVGSPICRPVTTVTTQTTGTSVKVDWTAPAEQMQWEVNCLQTENLVASQIVNTATYTFTNLQRGATYTFEVRNICGAEDTSVAVVSTPVTINQCNNVSDVTIVRACPTTAIISFTAAAGQNQWQISYQATGGGNTIVKTINRNLDTITGLMPNASYEVKIRPVCGEGDTGTYSALVSVQTGTCEPIENLMVPRVGATEDSIFACWNNNECHQNWEMSVVPMGSPRGEEFVMVNTYQGVYYKVDDYRQNYDVYVRGSCGDGEYGEWISVTSYYHGNIALSEASSVKVTLAPNPARDYTQLNIEGASGKVEMTLLTLEGKLLKKETINCRPSITKDVTLQGLSKGTFLIRLVHKNWTKVEKLIVQ